MNEDLRTALPVGSTVKYKKQDDFGQSEQTYTILAEIGRGGSSIVYEAKKSGTAKHYALKELYPLNDALEIRREGTELRYKNEADQQDIISQYCEKEQRILASYLPKNNSPQGRFFIYNEESFAANGTQYIVTDLDEYQSLAESKIKEDLQSLLYVLTDVCHGLAALHRNGVYHLDISSRNILIKDGCAKITDFGAAAIKEDLENQSLTRRDFVYTPGFSSMEVKRAVHEGVYEDVDASCDTYAVCAVLFRYTVGRSFAPPEDLTKREWEKDLHVKYHNKHTKSFINKLISILRRGLSGQTFRYSSANELAQELEDLTDKDKKDKVRQKITTIVCSALAVIAILWFFTGIITPAPEFKLQAQLETTYYSGDDIVFELELLDKTGTDGIHIEDATTALKLSGFTASREIVHIEDGNKYLVKLTDITFEEDGEKTIHLGDVYKSEWFRKQNKPFIYTFTGYTEEARIVIAEPSFTKVNDNTSHSVTYSVKIDLPTNQKASVSLSAEQLCLEGYTADIDIERVSNDLYNVTFYNIKGSGACTFFINEGACKLENGALSRKTVAPTFEIVEEVVSNHQIQMYLDVVSLDIRDGGYILLEHGSYSGQEFFSLLDESMIYLDGFTADVYFEHNSYILLDNLSLEKKKDLLIRAAAGAYVSKENGSYSDAVQCKPIEKVFNDSTIPTVAMMQLGKDSRIVKAGGDLIVMAFGSDESSCFLNKTTDMFLTTGFSYDDCQISVMGLTIHVVYTNVRPLGNNDEECFVIIKNGTFKDLSGNESRQVKFPFTITP